MLIYTFYGRICVLLLVCVLVIAYYLGLCGTVCDGVSLLFVFVYSFVFFDFGVFLLVGCCVVCVYVLYLMCCLLLLIVCVFWFDDYSGGVFILLLCCLFSYLCLLFFGVLIRFAFVFCLVCNSVVVVY